jgi:hypothetical protein
MAHRGHFSNRTHWNTAQVKALVYKIGSDEGFSVAKMRKLKYEISYHGAGDFGCLGKAVLGDSLKSHGLWMRLVLPKNGDIDIVRFAMTIAHEWAHVKGYDHADMIDSTRWYYHMNGNHDTEYEAKCRERYAWAKEWKIEADVSGRPSLEEVKQKERVKKLAQAQRMAKRTASRIKRLQTALKKWQRRVRLYSK